MFWDNIAWVYDIFADGINRKANRKLCKVVAGLISPTDDVLECACGTGLLSGVIAKRCKSLTATDFSAKMLTRARKKYGQYPHVQFEQADILHLPYPDARFDAVVTANVIHLLDNPHQALLDKGKTNRVSGVIGKAGADFKREFTLETYRQFFADAGYTDVQYTMCEGRIPCAVALIRMGASVGTRRKSS